MMIGNLPTFRRFEISLSLDGSNDQIKECYTTVHYLTNGITRLRLREVSIVLIDDNTLYILF